jgi:hypothetical protein
MAARDEGLDRIAALRPDEAACTDAANFRPASL